MNTFTYNAANEYLSIMEGKIDEAISSGKKSNLTAAVKLLLAYTRQLDKLEETGQLV